MGDNSTDETVLFSWEHVMDFGCSDFSLYDNMP